MKQAAKTQVAPAVMTLLGMVRSSDAQAVAEAQAWAVSRAMPSYVGCWQPDDAPTLPGTPSLAFGVSVPAWAQAVEVAVRIDADATVTSVDVDVVVGGASTTIAVDSSSNWRGTDTLAVSSTGSGHQLVEVGGTISGSGTGRIVEVEVRAAPLADADLPSP